ncbi:hypothetical protein KKJ01_21680 [Xenorhabdus bovienii]|uniref:DUF7380 domain-containing protein n=1 Tax=Xenorhabdus bovienii TaxID=40576 RepID=A0AAJ1N7Y4_XENBV|nr:hypothetical protein [Xenorhabdus bovienii]MDE1480716.1 hypothetical protein [Xenorhabdus bovienii]MDE9512459.1 hypothetical protein [Xenorhabdus bovienii]MDE9524093.1 hypothetical protein [Xenorhabdus bovienii]
MPNYIDSSIGYHSAYITYKEHSDITEEAGNELLANALDLGAKICCMKFNHDSRNEPFRLLIRNETGLTGFIAIADCFTAEQLEFIENVYQDIKQPFIKARFADLLWLNIHPKKVVFVKAAIESYLALPIEEETWHLDILNCWKRAISLSLQTNNTEALNAIEKTLLTKLKQDFSENPQMSLLIAELIVEKNICKSRQGDIADDLYQKACGFHASYRYTMTRRYSSLAKRMFNHQKKETEWLCLLLIAESLEFEGDSNASGDSPNQIAANMLYDQALQAYRKIPGQYRDELDITNKVVQIRDKITEAGVNTLNEMPLIKTHGEIDISDLIAKVRSHVEKKATLEEALLYFTSFGQSSYQNIRNRAIESVKEDPLSGLFRQVIKAEDGRTIANTPGLNLNDEKVDEIALTQRMIFHFQLSDIQLKVQGVILPALDQILSEFTVTRQFLIELCYYSPIVLYAINLKMQELKSGNYQSAG